MAGHGPNEQSLDPGSWLILGELRDLRLEMRADRQRADGERRKSDEERCKSDGERRKSDEERCKSDGERRKSDKERRKSDEERGSPARASSE